ncbi:tRNA binding domain-containing protein [Toxoplasma gondii ME49]|uniref:tRNA binding domain-containing protein n=4 Tax=Toxoplasma gondii TaxID=5811 RepID=A0A086QPX9_TOXGO|nr:tRNA binding domain-containing protein [Toxoplasma gondii ME49]EPT32123.1 tRNA binding domain-containing protein [Toxoplasma gondii ME49]KFH14661.1 tRNA binding domain-containing protein [Toxoplasma gondii MAS]KYF42516.1 tRNA binding domain-containing protein [Toxoplasma gondii ARI]PUA87426.1 tRNA binding domain-containing protein [Toxoplasma gondii TgCATBr9]|eukprot:XP_018638340.1 tRNA binding domain-containing protein [Toxoplasma gondii ME49]
MELIYDSTPAALATVLLARYVQPCLLQRQPPLSLSLCFLGNEAKAYLKAQEAELPVLLAAKEGAGAEPAFPPLREPATILRRLATEAAVTPASGKSSSAGALLLGGESDVEQAQVSQWLSFCCENNFAIRGASLFQHLHSHLATRTFFCGDRLTIADFAVFVSCYAWMASSSQKERVLYCNLTRWMDYIQHLPGVMNAVEQLPLLSLLPPPQPVAAPPTDSAAASTQALAKQQAASGSKQGKKKSGELHVNGDCRPNGDVPKSQKKEEKGDKGAGGDHKKVSGRAKQSTPGSSKGGAPGADSSRPVEDVTRLCMVVGQVKKVWRHPEADKLFCEEVDIGEPQVRMIASGLVPYMKAEELEGQKVIVLANMKPKNLRGFPSHGMLVCATSKDHSKCELMRPPPDTPIGERLTFEGLQGEPDPVMNTKEGKYPFAAVQPHFYTDDNRVGMYKTHRFMTKQGPVFCDSIVGGTIS